MCRLSSATGPPTLQQGVSENSGFPLRGFLRLGSRLSCINGWSMSILGSVLVLTLMANAKFGFATTNGAQYALIQGVRLKSYSGSPSMYMGRSGNLAFGKKFRSDLGRPLICPDDVWGVGA